MTILRAGLTRTREYGLVATISTLLTLLALSWLGYDFRSFSQILIGGHNDRYFNAWTLWQAITNVLTWPFDVGHASNFSADPASFALTPAPYGIAVVMLPLYLLSGGNMVASYNLTLIATFPLTALSAYVLLRYVSACSRRAAGFMALLVTFASFRFWHLEHIDMLSMHLFLLSLYVFHRVLDTPRWTWTIVLGASFWVLALSSGYLAVCFVISAALLSAVGLLFYTDAFVGRLQALIPAGLMSGLALWPMLGWRWTNPTFGTGLTQSAITYYSAQPGDWLVGFSALYTRQPLRAGQDVPLFVGFVLLLAAVVGLFSLIQHHEDGDAASAHLMSERSTLTSYGILAGLGWLLTLGPAISIGERTIALPYWLVATWPVFSVLPYTGRFIVVTITGLAVLGAYGLTRGVRGVRSRWQSIVWLGLCAAAFAEHVPYTGSIAPRTGDAARARLASDSIPERQDLAAWLDTLPADTPFVVYPIEAVNEALFDPVTRGRPLINGEGSLVPEWYAEGLTHEPISRYLMGSYAAYGADYLLLYGDTESASDLDWDEQIRRYQDNWDDVRLVGQFDDVRVYALHIIPVREVHADFDGGPPGQGWYDTLTDVRGNSFRWTSDSYATIDSYLVDDSAVRLEARIVKAASPEIFDSLVLQVNGEPVEMTFEEAPDGSRTYQALIPASVLGGRGGMTRFAFVVRGVVDEALADPDQGTYPYGLLFDWVSITPVDE